MKDVKLIVSKRVLCQVMKDFLNAVDASCGAEKKRCLLVQGDMFCTVITGIPLDMKKFFQYNLEQLLERGNDYSNQGFGYICANMGKRANYTKGFAQITKILLHELGHTYTYNQIIELYGEQEMERLYANAETQEDYIHVPTEWVATQWAINWLADPEHRKIAKAFEKEFWACFE